MKRYAAYFKAVLRHKWYVFLECRKLRVPLWRSVLHDWDKFLPKHFVAYAKSFYDPAGKTRYSPDPEFNMAWNNHQKINKHHWQRHILIMDKGDVVLLPMSDVDRREMLADWRGAGLAYGNPNTRAWYLDRREVFKKWIAPQTIEWLDQQLYIHL